MKSAIIVAIHCFDRHAQVRNSLKILSGLGQIVKESFVNVGALVIFARGGGGTSGISGWGCAAGTLEPLAYTRASSAKFCYPILE